MSTVAGRASTHSAIAAVAASVPTPDHRTARLTATAIRPTAVMTCAIAAVVSAGSASMSAPHAAAQGTAAPTAPLRFRTWPTPTPLADLLTSALWAAAE